MSISSNIKAGGAWVEITLRDNQFVMALRRSEKLLKDFGRSSVVLGQRLTAIGTAAAVPVGIAVVSFAKLESALLATQAAVGASDEEMKVLEKTALRLSVATGKSAVEIANLMTELGRAGFNPSQINEMTRAVLDLSKATGADAVLSAGIMASTIRQFNLEATDAARVADGLTVAANASFSSVQGLGESLEYAGPVAADLNMSLEETLALLGVLGNAGIQGSEAGTALRRLSIIGAAEAKKLQQIFGVSFIDSAGNLRPLIDSLHDVNEATKNLTSSDRAAKFNEAFGLLGITGASVLGKAGASAKDLLKEITDGTGQASEQAEKMGSGWEGIWNKTLSSLQLIGNAFSSALYEPLKQVGEFAIRAATGLAEYIKQNQKVAQVVAAVIVGLVGVGTSLMLLGSFSILAGAALGTIASVFTTLASLVGLVTPLLASAAGVLATLAGIAFSPFALIAASIAAIAVSAYTMRDSIYEVGSAIVSGLGSAVSYIAGVGKEILLWLTYPFREAIGFVSFYAKAGYNIISVFLDMVGTIGSSISKKFSLGNIASTVTSVLSSVLGELPGLVSFYVGGAIKFVKSAFKEIVSVGASIVSGAGSFIARLFPTEAGLFSAIISRIQTVFATIYTSFAAFFRGVISLPSMIAGAFTSSLGVVSRIFTSLGSTISTIWGGITGATSSFVEFFTGAVGEAQALFGRLYTTASDTLTGIYNAINKGDIQTAMEILWTGVEVIWLQATGGLSNLWESWMNGFQSIWNAGWFGLVNTVAELAAAVEMIWANSLEGVMSTWSQVSGTVSEWMLTAMATAQGLSVEEADQLRAENQAITNQNVSQAKSDAERRRNDIGQRLSATQAGISEQAAAAQAPIDAREQKRKAELDQKISELEQKLGALRAEASPVPSWVGPDRPDDQSVAGFIGPRSPSEMAPQVPNYLAGINKTMQFAGAASAATFRAADVMGLESGSQLDDIAKFTRQTARNTKKGGVLT